MTNTHNYLYFIRSIIYNFIFYNESSEIHERVTNADKK